MVKKPRTLGNYITEIFVVDHKVEHIDSEKACDFVSESSTLRRPRKL